MTSFHRLRFAAALLGSAAALVLPATAFAQAAPPPPIPAEPGKTLATVNGQPITEQDLAIAENDLGPNLPQLTPEQRRDYLLSYAIDLKLVSAAADKDKAAPTEEVQKRLDYYRQKILMEDLLTKQAKEAANPAAVKKLYDDTVVTIKPEEEVHAHHILVDTQADAKKVYDRLKAGEDFGKVAKEVSKDPGSADGGDLGWFTRDRMVKEFADAAFALKPGETSQPVKSQFGWHVIRLDERRQKAVPTFDQVRPQIEAYLTRKAQQDLILKLRGEAKIEKTAAAAPAVPAPGAPAPGAPAPGAPAPDAAPGNAAPQGTTPGAKPGTAPPAPANGAAAPAPNPSAAAPADVPAK